VAAYRNQAAIDRLVAIRQRHETELSPVVISGCIGPRGDGCSPNSFMEAEEAADYHALQAEVFADSEADLITAITMTYPGEAIGVVEAARRVGMPVVISFTVETDGRLPNGQTLDRRETCAGRSPPRSAG
jgi:S-methylmethionine-dependent homocysteine/selenocysteine methylase